MKVVICIENKDYPPSVDFGKIHRVVPDEKVKKHKMIRAIDESGGDYLYAETSFVAIELP